MQKRGGRSEWRDRGEKGNRRRAIKKGTGLKKASSDEREARGEVPWESAKKRISQGGPLGECGP